VASEDAFTPAKAAFGIYGGFWKDVAQEIGLEKALSLHARRGQLSGAMVAEMTKQQLGDRPFDLKTFASVLAGGFRRLGFACEIEEDPASVKISALQCPLYEGFKSAALDDRTIELLCTHKATATFAEEKKVFPQLSMCLKFRAAPDQPCVEEYALEKQPVGMPVLTRARSAPTGPDGPQ
jgi:hypothetical protein